MNTPSTSARARWVCRAAVVAAAVLLCACKNDVDLHTGLTDHEANRVVAALRNDGMRAVKLPTKNGVTVSVAEGDLARATRVLSAQGLPQHTSARMGEVFKKEGLISSPLEERARYIYALSQELEATLAQIDGVVVARVHVVLPEKVAPGEPIQPPSAAVFIKHLPSLEPDVISHRVKQLAARAIPGMGLQALDRVSVVFVVADAVPQRPPEPFDATPWIAAAIGALLLVLAIGTTVHVRRHGWPRGLKPAGIAQASAPAPATTPKRGPDRPPVVA